jgi:hypothetical protein
MNLYRIHPAPDAPFVTTVACCGDAAHALELARTNSWVEEQLTSEAVETIELWEVSDVCS